MLVITVKYQGQHNLTVRGDCVLRVQAQCVGRWFDSQCLTFPAQLAEETVFFLFFILSSFVED